MPRVDRIVERRSTAKSGGPWWLNHLAAQVEATTFRKPPRRRTRRVRKSGRWSRPLPRPSAAP